MTKRRTKPQLTGKATPIKVVALLDRIEVAKGKLYAAAKSGVEDALVPDVLASTIDGTEDVLLVVWRAWDIYAIHTDDGWIIRADRVR